MFIQGVYDCHPPQNRAVEMLSKNTTYMSRLDHLRFFAAFLVLIYHWHAWTMITGHDDGISLSIIKEGETGVSLFMVLSGFILTHISMGREINYRHFIYNRFLRIYPLYVFVLFVDAYSNNRAMDFFSFIQYLAPFNNLHGQHLPKFAQMWTIAVEFQFYLIFPFLVTFLFRYGARYIVAIVVLAVFVRSYCYLADGSVRDAAYWTILGRIDQFCVGMLAAIVYAGGGRVFARKFALPLGFVLIYAWIFFFEKITGGGYYADGAEFRAVWIVSPTLEAIVWSTFVLAYLQHPWKMPASVDRSLAFLGATSFSIYTWHWPLLKLIDKHPQIAAFHTWIQNFMFIIFPVVMMISIFSYYVIELPFLSARRTYVSQPREMKEAPEVA